MTATISSSLASLALCLACKPDLGAPVSLVSDVTVLAVRSEPPEAAPGATVHLSVLVASPQGTLRDTGTTWSDCITPKPPVENNFVSAACVSQPDDPGKEGTEIDDVVPAQACTLFGPVAPPVQPPVRARDADGTGGFYFPVRAAVRGRAVSGDDLLAFGAVRLARSCGLPYAAPVDRQAFAKAYLVNANPVAGGLTASWPGAPTQDWPAEKDAPEDIQAPQVPAEVPSGSVVTLTQAWTAESAETYPVYDVGTLQISSQREAISVAWFTTAGVLLHDRSGRAADESASFAENTWTAPVVSSETEVHLWTVLRDSRGGVAFASFVVRVLAP